MLATPPGWGSSPCVSGGGKPPGGPRRLRLTPTWWSSAPGRKFAGDQTETSGGRPPVPPGPSLTATCTSPPPPCRRLKQQLTSPGLSAPARQRQTGAETDLGYDLAKYSYQVITSSIKYVFLSRIGKSCRVSGASWVISEFIFSKKREKARATVRCWLSQVWRPCQWFSPTIVSLPTCPACRQFSLWKHCGAERPHRLKILSIVVITMPMPSSSNGKQQKPSLYFYEKKCFLVFPSTIQYYKRTRTFSQHFPVKPTKPNVWVKDPSLENDLSHARLCRLSGPERK